MSPSAVERPGSSPGSRGPLAALAALGPRGPLGRRAVLAGLLFALALALRLPELDVFLTPDETRWACRSANFWNALSQGRFEDTYQKEHPGVITMWLGGLGQPVDPAADWAVACRDIPASELVEIAPRPALDAITNRLFAGRARVAVFVSAGVAAIYLLAAGVVGARAALLGGVLLAADPFMVALGRVLHLDAVTATLMTLALLALLRARMGGPSTGDSEASGDDGRRDPAGRRDSAGRGNPARRRDLAGGREDRDFRRWTLLAAAGAIAGVAALNKSPGLFLGPVAGLIFLVDGWRRNARQGSAATGRSTASPTTAPIRPSLPAVATAVVLDTARPLLAWGIGAVAAYIALWPAMWVAPIDSLAGVLLGATDYASEGHEGFNYFMGQPLLDPGPLFYPVAWFVRATPIAVAGLALAVVRALRPAIGEHAVVASSEGGAGRRGARREAVAWLVAFAVLFGVFMTLGAKKFDRYLLPSLPALALVAGWGWAGAVVWVERAWRGRRGSEGSSGDRDRVRSSVDRDREGSRGDRDLARSPGGRGPEGSDVDRATAYGITFWVASALLALAMLATALPLRPYFYQYFNPLAGGQRAAPGILLVGWGEGIDGAARWLNAEPEPATLEVATRYRSAFGPLFRGRALEMNKIDPATVDYYLFYLNQLQRHLDPELMERHFPAVDWSRPFDELWSSDAITLDAAGPVEVVRIGDIDYAWLFENDTWRAAAAFIDERSDPDDDAILARADSRFARMYAGPLPIVPLDPDASESEVVRTLRSAFDAHGAVWLVRYDEIAPRPALARLDYEIGTQTFNTARIGLTELRITRHELFADATASHGTEFGAAPIFSALPGAVRFGDALALDRIARTSEALFWGRDMGLTLEWRAERDLDANYTAFLHLIGPDGRRWAHEDRMIGDADLVPTERWAVGKPQHDARTLRIPAGTPPGAYRLHLGVYDAATGERLPVAVDGQPQPDDVYAMPIEVGRSPAVPDRAALELDYVAGGAGPADSDPPVGMAVAPDLALIGISAPDGVHGGRTAPLGFVWDLQASAASDASAATPEAELEPDSDSEATAVRLRIVDGREREVGRGEFELVPGTAPEDRRAGGVMRAWYEVEIDPRALAGEARLTFEVLSAAGRAVSPRARPGSAPNAEHTLPITVDGPSRRFEIPPRTELGDALEFRFGEIGRLRGASIPAGVERSEGDSAAAIVPRLWWEAPAEVDVGYTRFVHVIDAGGTIRAQVDGPPTGPDGDRPTTSWLAGEFVPDAPAIPLGADLAPGEYTLAVGLYDAATGERVPAFGPDGAPVPDDRVVVGRVRLR